MDTESNRVDPTAHLTFHIQGSTIKPSYRAGFVVAVHATALIGAGISLSITSAILFQAFVRFAAAAKARLLRALPKGIISTLLNGQYCHGSSTLGAIVLHGILAGSAPTSRRIAKDTTLEAHTIQLETLGLGTSAKELLGMFITLVLLSSSLGRHTSMHLGGLY